MNILDAVGRLALKARRIEVVDVRDLRSCIVAGVPAAVAGALLDTPDRRGDPGPLAVKLGSVGAPVDREWWTSRCVDRAGRLLLATGREQAARGQRYQQERTQGCHDRQGKRERRNSPAHAHLACSTASFSVSHVEISDRVAS